MQTEVLSTETPETIRDYSLVGKESMLAFEKGLAEAPWYLSPVPREEMRKLLVRRNGPAIRDSLIWFGLILGSGYLFFILWGTWWCILPYIVYSVLYGSTSDSRWHESGHGTAFRTDWMNNVLYEIASFMVFRQSTVWRWSHTRHHSDTIIRGRDPEIAVKRPPNLFKRFLQHFAIFSTPAEFRIILRHATGRIHPEVATFVPMSEYRKVFWKARIYLLIYAAVIALAVYFKTPLPLFFIGLPTFLGAWLMVIYGTTQHAGLQENVLDHRLNSRTVYMNRINRYLYWNMNYHIEHHMYPMVPYHALPRLHELVKDDMPGPCTSIIDAYREILPALRKQSKDPAYFVERKLPAGINLRDQETAAIIFHGESRSIKEGWIEVCREEDIPAGDVARFDYLGRTWAVYHTSEGRYHATDGICTHGNTHLGEGLLIGEQIECAKHNGRFDIRDGSVKRPPVCVALKTYAVRREDGRILLGLDSEGGAGVEEEKKALEFTVVSNENVATFIKELVLKPADGDADPADDDPEKQKTVLRNRFSYRPGEYIQLEVPGFEIGLEYIDVKEPYRQFWRDNGIFRMFAINPAVTRRNFSMASNPEKDDVIRFNVRLELPPEGLNCSAGVGSSYLFNLKPGDRVRAYGPYGDFLIRETEREMVYIGGGAGMAPLRSHISHLLETMNSGRRISFWYGARSLQELFYTGYFEDLERRFGNFRFHTSLSEPRKSDHWEGSVGLIHELVRDRFLSGHPAPAEAEYYLCGPPAMIEACLSMLADYSVPENNIAFDEF